MKVTAKNIEKFNFSLIFQNIDYTNIEMSEVNEDFNNIIDLKIKESFEFDIIKDIINTFAKNDIDIISYKIKLHKEDEDLFNEYIYLTFTILEFLN